MNRLLHQLRSLNRDEDGQVIVLLALGMVAFLLVAALVLDVARVYTVTRYERSVADAAALAGAQDLQDPGSRNVSPNDYIYAREHALELLNRELGGTSTDITSVAGCDPGMSALPAGGSPDPASSGSNITGCQIPGTPYTVGATTPYSGAIEADAARALKVTISQPHFALTFGNLVCLVPGSNCASGVPIWSPTIASVAGNVFGGQYAVVTLQPPNLKPNLTDANLCGDLNVKGNNTVLDVRTGDIGTNTSATTTNAGLISMASGYKIDHYDDITNAACGLYTNPTWQTVDGVPQGRRIHRLINDPAYMYPSFSGAPTYTSQSQGVTSCTGPGYPTGDSRLPSGTVCYNPGKYLLGPNGNQAFSVGTGQTAYLLPGAYYFKSGLSVGGSLYGGLISNQPGVVLEFTPNYTLSANNAVNFVLNVGGYSCQPTDKSCWAAPAKDFSPAPASVQTPQGWALSIEVDRNSACFVNNVPQNADSCASSIVNMAGSGNLEVAGVIYGPSDNMNINGNSSQVGLVGQIYSWTITYTGGSTLSQEYPGNVGNGQLRLDSACSPGEPCP